MAIPRFTPRAGSSMPGRIRRQADGQIDSAQRFAKERGVEVGKDGRVGITLARDSGLEITRDGLRLSPGVVGEKNRAQMDQIADADETTPTAAANAAKINEILSELRRTKRLRGI